MKQKIMYIWSVLLAMFMMTAIISCTDDGDGYDSTLQVSGNYKISTFLLKRDVWDFTNGTSDIKINLFSHTKQTTKEFDVAVTKEDDKFRIAIHIPLNATIEDGDYDLTAILPSGEKLCKRLKARFKGEKLQTVMSSSIVFNLEGEGTAVNPYLITSALDFNEFINTLMSDKENHAKGLYFKQTRSFAAPPISYAVTGQNYIGYAFAGIYDGGKNMISLVYSGSKNEKNVGLFQILHDGAEVRNLTVNVNIRGVGENGGAICGMADGTVLIDSCTVSGSLSDCNNRIGGFVGYAKGNLTIHDSHLLATVAGSNSIGGVVGYFAGGELNVDGFKNFDGMSRKGVIGITATGNEAAGIAGVLTNGSCKIKDVHLEHPVTEEDKNVFVIYSKGNIAGGVIGKAELNAESSFSNVTVNAPVRSEGNCVGGMIGSGKFDGLLKLTSCHYFSYAKGNDYVGGFIGKMLSAKNGIKILENNNVVSDQGYHSVDGHNYVGGFAGYINSAVQLDNSFKINTPVIATASFSGGVAGCVEGVTLKVGNFKLLNSMHVKGSDATGGLVGMAKNATVEGTITDTKIDGGTIPASSTFTANFVGIVSNVVGGAGTSIGGIVGYSENSTITGVCFGGTVDGVTRVGGIVGHLKTTKQSVVIKNCVNQNIVKGSSNEVGGIIGRTDYTQGTINHLLNYGAVTGGVFTAGIIGHLQINNGDKKSLTLQRLINKGAIKGVTTAAGIISYIEGPDHKDNGSSNTISYCANYGSVETTGFRDIGNYTERGYVGGILGRGVLSGSRIEKCANHGDITACKEKDADIGGICGRMGYPTSAAQWSTNISLRYCCNRGKISGGGHDTHAGGVLGRSCKMTTSNKSDWIINDIYNAGEVCDDHNEDNGGLVGYTDPYTCVRNGYNYGQVHYGNACVGSHTGKLWHEHLYYLKDTGSSWASTGKFNKDQRGNETTYDNFDFQSVWKIDTSKNGGYPILRDCPYQ